VKTKINEDNWKTCQDAILYNSSARIEKNDGLDKEGPSVQDKPYLTKGNVTE
jgi:hypothetical protein